MFLCFFCRAQVRHGAAYTSDDVRTPSLLLAVSRRAARPKPTMSPCRVATPRRCLPPDALATVTKACKTAASRLSISLAEIRSTSEQRPVHQPRPPRLILMREQRAIRRKMLLRGCSSSMSRGRRQAWRQAGAVQAGVQEGGYGAGGSRQRYEPFTEPRHFKQRH